MIHLGPNFVQPNCDQSEPEHPCYIYTKTDVPIRFPPDNNVKRSGCKVKDLNYWVMRQESDDGAGNRIVNLYANDDKSFTETGLPGGNVADGKKYTREIAWVQCTPGFINEVHYRGRPKGSMKSWYNGCGVTTELVKICILDSKLNKETTQLIRNQLQDDKMWRTKSKKLTIETLTQQKYINLKKLMFTPPDAENPNQLRKEFCSNLIGIIPYNRLLKPEEDDGLKNVLKAAKEAGIVDKTFFKHLDDGNTKFKRNELNDFYDKYKNGRNAKKDIVADEEDEMKEVTGKIFFCKGGSDFYNPFK